MMGVSKKKIVTMATTATLSIATVFGATLQTTFAASKDTTPPTITVKSESIGYKKSANYKKVSFKLHDSGKVDYIVINGTKRDLTNNYWSDWNNVSVGKAGGIKGKNVLEAFDVSGNSSKYVFYLDGSGPKITVKTGKNETVGDLKNKRFSKVSFKLQDETAVDYIVLNGVKRDLTDNRYSDLNFVSVKEGGGIQGKNVLQAFDVFGNYSTYEFYLDGAGPRIEVKLGKDFTIGDIEEKVFSKVSFKLIDDTAVDYIVVNGVKRDLTNNDLSDWNFVSVGQAFGVEGQNKIEVYDIFGNSATYEFTLVSESTAQSPDQQ